MTRNYINIISQLLCEAADKLTAKDFDDLLKVIKKIIEEYEEGEEND